MEDPRWHDPMPIYRQLLDHVVGMILDNTLREGAALPSVRKLAAKLGLNGQRFPLVGIEAAWELQAKLFEEL